MSYLKASELCEAGTSSYFLLCPWPFATNDRPEVDICHMTEAAEGKGGGQEWEWTPGTRGGNREAAHTQGACVQGQCRDQPLKTLSQHLNL